MFVICNVRTDVDACDCTRGLYGHRRRVCTGSVGVGGGVVTMVGIDSDGVDVGGGVV